MEGTKVFVAKENLAKIDSTIPPGLSRTAWIALLLQIGLRHQEISKKQDQA